jgi:hypothetical protein
MTSGKACIEMEEASMLAAVALEKLNGRTNLLSGSVISRSDSEPLHW